MSVCNEIPRFLLRKTFRGVRNKDLEARKKCYNAEKKVEAFKEKLKEAEEEYNRLQEKI